MFGPLRSPCGRIKRKHSQTRLIVWFDAIMQGVSVELDPRNLELMKKSASTFPQLAEQVAGNQNESPPFQRGIYRDINKISNANCHKQATGNW